MKRRQWAILGGIAILVLAVVIKNVLAASAEENAPVKRSQRSLVTYQDLKSGPVPIRIPIDGPVQAYNKIEIYSEVTGIVSSRSQKFKEGQAYADGELLLDLDNSEALSAYRSARSNFLSLIGQVLPDLKLDFESRYEAYYKYLQGLNQSKGLVSPPQETDEKLKLFLSGRGFYSSFQTAESARVRLEKFQLKAPFKGTVTEALVEPGQLVRAGQLLGEFIGEGQFEMLANVGPNEARMIKLGDSVSLTSTDGFRNYQGVVYRKNQKVDPATQSIGIFIRLQGQDLQDGEYLRGDLSGRALPAAMQIERKLLIDENSLYQIVDSTLQVLQVNILHRDPQTVIIAAPDSSLRIPAAKIPGAYPGMKVRLQKATRPWSAF